MTVYLLHFITDFPRQTAKQPHIVQFHLIRYHVLFSLKDLYKLNKRLNISLTKIFYVLRMIVMPYHLVKLINFRIRSLC